MKKLPIAILCMLLAGLCACGQAAPETTTESTTETPTTAIELSKVEIPTDESDPYSFLVKGYYENSFSASLNSNNNYIKQKFFALYDIDGDGTEEMVWGSKRDEGMHVKALYTIQNGIAVEQYELTRWQGEVSEPKRSLFVNGTLRVESNYETGELGYKYYRFEDGELKGQLSLSIYPDERYTRYDPTIAEEVPITQKEYDSLREKYEGDGQVVELDWKPLAEYGR